MSLIKKCKERKIYCNYTTYYVVKFKVDKKALTKTAEEV